MKRLYAYDTGKQPAKLQPKTIWEDCNAKGTKWEPRLAAEQNSAQNYDQQNTLYEIPNGY